MVEPTSETAVPGFTYDPGGLTAPAGEADRGSVASPNAPMRTIALLVTEERTLVTCFIGAPYWRTDDLASARQ